MLELIVRNNHAKQKGFTLLEIVIAMAIFAVVMILVMGGLNMVVRAQEKVSLKAKRLGDVQMAMAVLAGDLTQLVPRPIRGVNDEVINPVVIDMASDVRLEFTSGGIINPNAMYPRSTLQRVGYGLANSTLMRFNWPVLDRVSTTTMGQRHLLNNVAGFTVEYVNQRGEFVNNTDEAGDAVAVYIDIDLGSEGHLQRLFALHGEIVNVQQP
jgi:general secretion pathway protein J